MGADPAVSPARLAVARLSDRRLQLQPRRRDRGRGGLHQGPREPGDLAGKRAAAGHRRRRRRAVRGGLARRRGRGLARRSTPSPSAPPPGAAPRRWRWNRASRAARSCRSRAPPGRIPPSMPPTSGWRASCRCRSPWRLAAAAHGIALDRALEGYLHAFTANLISAAVRTVPLGQSDGQIALAAPRARRAAGDRGGAGGDLARRGRHRHAPARLVLAAPRDPVHAAVPLMTVLFAFLLFAGRRRGGRHPCAVGAGRHLARGQRADLARSVWATAAPHAARLAMRRRGAVLAAGRRLAVVVIAWPRRVRPGPDRFIVSIGAVFFSCAAPPAIRSDAGAASSRAEPFRTRATSTSIRRSACALGVGFICAAGAGDAMRQWSLARSPARRRRRPGRVGQDRAGRAAVQEDARRLRHRRRHQRHLHQGRRRVPDPRRRARARAHRRRRDRRLPAHGDPRGRLDQPGGRVRHRAQMAGARDRVRRIRRRQPRRHLLARAGRSHDLRDRRGGRREDPAQGRARHHPVRPAGDQQDRPGAAGRRQPRRHGPRCAQDARRAAVPVLQSQGEQGGRRHRRLHRTPGRLAGRHGRGNEGGVCRCVERSA